MKTINFYFTLNPDLSWNPYTITNAGLGGNYVAIWNLSQALAKRGHSVTVYSYIHREDVYKGVAFKHINRIPHDNPNPDLLISCESRMPSGIVPRGTKVNWIHRNVGDGLDFDNFDYHVFASEFHKQYLEAKEGEIIPNGVDLELFKSNPRKLGNDITFVGHPIKGMQYIPGILSKIREKIPSVVVHIYGNAEIWGWRNDSFIPLQSMLIKNKILYHGRTSQTDVARFMAQSKIFLYPSTFQEPFGIAVLEAMACGCVPVASSVGNIPDLIKGCGFSVRGLPTDFGWNTQAAEKVVELLLDREMFKEYSEKCIVRAKAYSWDIIAELWENKFLT